MAQMTRELLTADQMAVTLYCYGQSYVGWGIGGTWTGTINFEAASIDDPNRWIADQQTPFASGTAVSSATATGNWFSQVKANIYAKRARFTRTTGSAQVIGAASLDQSYQDAFLGQTTIFNSASATSGTNTLTQAAQANRSWNLAFCEVSVAGPGWGAAGRVTIYDGGVTGSVLFEEFLGSGPLAGSVGYTQKLNLPTDDQGIPTLVNTPGNAMTIVLRGMGNNASIINTKFKAG